jgi:hypothetical protein
MFYDVRRNLLSVLAYFGDRTKCQIVWGSSVAFSKRLSIHVQEHTPNVSNVLLSTYTGQRQESWKLIVLLSTTSDKELIKIVRYIRAGYQIRDS